MGQATGRSENYGAIALSVGQSPKFDPRIF